MVEYQVGEDQTSRGLRTSYSPRVKVKAKAMVKVKVKVKVKVVVLVTQIRFPENLAKIRRTGA